MARIFSPTKKFLRIELRRHQNCRSPENDGPGLAQCEAGHYECAYEAAGTCIDEVFDLAEQAGLTASGASEFGAIFGVALARRAAYYHAKGGSVESKFWAAPCLNLDGLANQLVETYLAADSRLEGEPTCEEIDALARGVADSVVPAEYHEAVAALYEAVQNRKDRCEGD